MSAFSKTQSYWFLTSGRQYWDQVRAWALYSVRTCQWLGDLRQVIDLYWLYNKTVWGCWHNVRETLSTEPGAEPASWRCQPMHYSQTWAIANLVWRSWVQTQGCLSSSVCPVPEIVGALVKVKCPLSVQSLQGTMKPEWMEQGKAKMQYPENIDYNNSKPLNIKAFVFTVTLFF